MEISHIYHSAARFVDRDMLTRFLGFGVGHKGQSSHIVPSDEAASNDSVANEADDLSRKNTAAITPNQNLSRRRLFDVNAEEAVDDIQDGDDGDSDVDSDDNSESEDNADDDDEIYCNL